MQRFKNVAIIAHVDHGKTSLVDTLLTASGTMKSLDGAELIMDSNDQEKERGITIYAKNTSVQRQDTIINIVDTPGHADFGSEVERVLGMVDSVLLVVDAYEGPMPQTKFVLKKSLEKGLRPIVVINKIDKSTARPDWVIDELFDLFIQLGASDEQADFSIIYTSARDGYSFLDMKEFADAQENGNMEPLLNFIMEHVDDAPHHPNEPFRMQVVNLDYDNFVGRLGVGRIAEGTVKAGQEVIVHKADGASRKAKVNKIYRTVGISKVEVKEGECGDIVIIAGIPDIFVGDTIGVEGTKPYPAIHIDEPTLTMDFLVNNSPFAGREGKYVTSRNIVARLEKELETNVGLQVEIHDGGNRCSVAGRGELHLSVLIETMRREGFEIQVSAPQVLMREENGQTMEPVELVVVNVADGLSGSVIQMLSDKKGLMQNMLSENGITTLEFHVPTR
jgi:GTP-binding protein